VTDIILDSWKRVACDTFIDAIWPHVKQTPGENGETYLETTPCAPTGSRSLWIY
jgi:hypothetical protein